MTIYDYIDADTIEADDLIVFENDPIEVSSVIADGAAVLVKGYSHLTGDMVSYIMPATAQVALWTA